MSLKYTDKEGNVISDSEYMEIIISKARNGRIGTVPVKLEPVIMFPAERAAPKSCELAPKVPPEIPMLRATMASDWALNMLHPKRHWCVVNLRSFERWST